MKDYRVKSQQVEAVQFDPEQQPWPEAVIAWKEGPSHGDGSYGYIKTDDGRAHVRAGDWLVRGPSGALHICKDAIFTATYEPVEEHTTLKRHVLKRGVINTDTFRSGTKGDLHDGYPTD